MDFRFLKKEIKRDIIGYIAIVLMTLVGVGFLSGLFSCLPDIKYSVDDYYKEANFHDIRITSALGFPQEDIREVERIEGLDKIQPVHSLYSLASINGSGSYAAYVRSVERSTLEANPYAIVDTPVLQSGSYPATQKSCLIVSSGATDVDVKIGDRLALLTNTDECTENTFTVTGFVNTPEFTSNIKEEAPIGNGKTEIIVYVSSEIFTDEAYCNEILCTVKNDEDFSTFDKGYTEKVENIKNQLVKLGKDRADNFAVTLANQYQDDLNKARKHYEYVKGQTEEELKTISRNISTLETSISELETAVASEEAEVMRLKIEAETLAPAIGSESSEQAVTSEIAPLVNEESSEAVSSAESETESTAQSSEQEKPKEEDTPYTRALKKYEEANKKYESDKKDLETKKTTLKSLKAEYSILKGLAGKKVDNAEQSVEELDGEQEEYSQKWSVYTRNDNISHNSFLMNAQKINTISGFFPVIFFIVAVSLVLTMISRMINTRSREIGIWQSFGYSDRAITLKYVIYSLSSTLIGGIIGIVLGVIAVPKLMFKTYSVFFNFPEIKLLFRPFATFGALIIEAALVLAITVFSCFKLLRGSPARLLRDDMPADKKEIFLQKKKRWKKFSASKKERLLNIFTYKSRLAVMLIGITGCTALVFTCFALNSSISSVGEKQYELRPFDITVNLSGDYEKSPEISEFLANKNIVKEYIEINQANANAVIGGKTYEITAVLMDNEKAGDYYKTENSFSIKEEIEDKSVIISRNFAVASGLGEGDEFSISYENKKVNLKVTAVSQSYMGNYVFLGKTACKPITSEFGKSLLIKNSNNNFNRNETVSKLLATNKVSSVVFAQDETAVFNNAAEKIKGLLKILIVSAVLLGFAVILITALLNYRERKEALKNAILNGVSAQKVSKGILSENLSITVFGIIFGIISGVILHIAVVSLADMGDVVLGYGMGIMPFAVSVIFPLVLTLAVNFALYPMIKYKQKKTAL